MVLHLLTLAHLHGPAAVISGFVVYKYAKYRLVCWRCECVNGQVRELTTKRLDGDTLHGDSGSKQAEGPLGQKILSEDAPACAACSCPLWLRRDESECKVQLLECGCVLHSTCLVDAALQQHGMAVPPISDPSRVFVLLRRFFGVDSIAVDSVRCPGCGAISRSWRKIQDGDGKVVSAASRKATARALSRGGALRLEGLRATLQKIPPGMVAKELDHWQAAAQSDKALCALLRQEGPEASRQLIDLLLSPALQGMVETSESSSAESEGKAPMAASGDRQCRLHAASEDAASVAAEGDAKKRHRSYSEFLLFS